MAEPLIIPLVAPDMEDEEACRIGTLRLQAAMLAKLGRKRKQGRAGWHRPEECDPEEIAEMLVNHLGKGDPVDIANFAMMLHNREGGGKALRKAWLERKREVVKQALDTPLRQLSTTVASFLKGPRRGKR